MKKLLLIAILALTNTSAFAGFEQFQCTSKTTKITRLKANRDLIVYENLITQHPAEQLNLDGEANVESEKAGSTGTFEFTRRIHFVDYKYELVITEKSDSEKTGTGVLSRSDTRGTDLKVVESDMECEL